MTDKPLKKEEGLIRVSEPNEGGWYEKVGYVPPDYLIVDDIVVYPEKDVQSAKRRLKKRVLSNICLKDFDKKWLLDAIDMSFQIPDGDEG